MESENIQEQQSLFSALKLRNFRMMMTGQFLSDFGNWLDITALTVLIVYHWQMGPGAVATLMMTLAFPWVILGPLMSVWVDRLPRRPLMVMSALVRAILVMSLVWVPNLYVLLSIVFAKAVLGAINFSARQSAVRVLVSETYLPQAVSLNQMSTHITQIIAPALGGGIIGLTGIRSVFVIESVLLLAAAIFLAKLPTLANESDQTKQKPHFWNEFAEGVRHVASKRILAMAILLISIGFFLVFLYDGLLAVWTKELNLGESAFGLMISSIGLGSVLGVVGAGQWTIWRSNPFRLMAFAALTAGSINCLIGLGGLGQVALPSIFWWNCVFLLFGMSGAIATVPYGYILQKETPKELMGRVSSVGIAIQNASMLAAPAIGAVLAKWMNVGGVFLLAGMIMGTLAIVVLIFGKQITGATEANTSVEKSVRSSS